MHCKSPRFIFQVVLVIGKSLRDFDRGHKVRWKRQSESPPSPPATCALLYPHRVFVMLFQWVILNKNAWRNWSILWRLTHNSLDYKAISQVAYTYSMSNWKSRLFYKVYVPLSETGSLDVLNVSAMSLARQACMYSTYHRNRGPWRGHVWSLERIWNLPRCTCEILWVQMQLTTALECTH